MNILSHNTLFVIIFIWLIYLDWRSNKTTIYYDLKDEINSLNERLDELVDKLEEAEGKIDDLEMRVDNLDTDENLDIIS